MARGSSGDTGEASAARNGKKRAAVTSRSKEQNTSDSFTPRYPRFDDPKVERFLNLVMGRTTVKDKPARITHRPTRTDFKALGLEVFFKQLERIRTPWVTEFYAAAAVAEGGNKSGTSCEVVIVRGRPVDYSLRAIQELYKLPTVKLN